MASTCPSQDALRGLVSGSLPTDEADTLQLHIEQCESCQAALQALVADGTFWESAAASLSDQDAIQHAGGPALDRVVEELRQQSPEDAEEIGEAIELKLSFIEPPVEPGTIGRLQNYDILRVAGRGGMGIVVKAFDRSLRRVVAIKLLAPHLAGNGQARQRFVREGRAAAGICHEHVITIHAVEETPPFLVMNYVQGETLEARIHRNGALDVRETVRIAKQIAQGLAAAHAQGVVHRDIKPANILLENGVARVRITDFGLARAVDDASLTQSGVVAGTPQYMAPEQASGEAVDERADLFSLGSVIYTMLAGHAPFRATTAMGVLKRLCDHSARPIREINPDVPDWLVLLLNRLHAKWPADRFQSANEVAAVLERGLAALQNGATATSVVPHLAAAVAGTEPDMRRSTMAPEGESAAAVRDLPRRTEVAMPRWLLLPIPVWLLIIPLILVALGPLGQEAAAIATMTLIGLCFFGALVYFVKKLTSPLSPTEDLQQAGAVRRFGLRLQEISPASWTGRLGWLALWCLPIAIWTLMFYIQEEWALRMPVESLPDRNRDILMTLAGVFCVWWVIAIAWFRRRRADGTRFFERGRWKRVSLTLAFAAAFCVLGFDVWLGDVMSLKRYLSAQQDQQAALESMTVARQSLVAGGHSLRVDFEKPLNGTVIVIELPGDEHYRFTSDHSGIVLTGIGSQSGTFPWKATVGHTEFATGEVTLAPGLLAEINVPQPKLEQLVAGRWHSITPQPGGMGGFPGGGYAMSGVDSNSEQDSYELEFSPHQLLLASRSGTSSVERIDCTIEIDDSVTPALINLVGTDGSRLAGIMRFVPGRVPTDQPMGSSAAMSGGMMMGMPGGMGDMYGGGGSGYEQSRTLDVLEVCLNDGRGLRPWEFETREQTGQTLLRMHRSEKTLPLRDEMAFEPTPVDATKQHLEESLTAWSKRLTIRRTGTNSLGMELVLVPPTELSVPAEPTRSQRIALPGFDVKPQDHPPRSAPIVVRTTTHSRTITYPFVISRQPVTRDQFRQFVEESAFITDAERGTPTGSKPTSEKTAPDSSAIDASADVSRSSEPAIGGWQAGESIYDWASDISWQKPADSMREPQHDAPVTVISWRDANAFCEWLSVKESRQYRLPTANEWVAAMQIGFPRWTEPNTEVAPPPIGSFDARPEHVLQIKSPESVFAEWTGDSVNGASSNRQSLQVLVRRQATPDGLMFHCNQQFEASASFRASDVSFRVVTELQTLK